jgi:hypothetical protein
MRKLLPLIALLLLALAAPSSAAAATGADVRADCVQDGTLDGTYTVGELNAALQSTPSNEDEYSAECRLLIEQRRNSLLSGGANGGAGGAGGPFGTGGGLGGGGAAFDSIPDTPAQALALARATGGDKGGATMAAPKLSIGGQSILPGIGIPALAGALNDMPLAEKLALISLAALVAAAGALVARRRFPAARRVALRLVRR